MILLRAHLEEWLSKATASGLAHRTVKRYREFVEGFIVPELGDLALNAITPKHVDDVIATWRAQPRRDGRKGFLASRTIRHAFVVLKTGLGQAIRWERIERNPCMRVDAPHAPQAKIRVLDENGAAKLLEGLRGSDVYVPTLVALTTGLRRGELLGLTWDAVDLERGILHVRQSLERVERELRFKEPKTPRSRRAIGVPAVTVAALKQHRAELREMAKASGRPFDFNPHKLVFPWADGTPWDPERFTSRFMYAVRKKKLPRVSVHGLRHTFATMTLRSGTALKVTSDLLGHSSVNVTGDVYVHVLSDQHEAAATRIGGALTAAIERHAAGPASGDKSVTKAG